jgi:hypothetical protein
LQQIKLQIIKTLVFERSGRQINRQLYYVLHLECPDTKKADIELSSFSSRYDVCRQKLELLITMITNLSMVAHRLTISYYLRATLCFTHFQTIKIMNCFSAIFHQIHRLLYANGENFTFLVMVCYFFGLNYISEKIEKQFVGAGGWFTRP